MIFSTFEPYNNSDIIIKEEIEACFVCYEVLDGINSPIKLNNNIYYLKKCKCNGFIHINCLNKWVNEHFSCPICRGLIVKKINGSHKITTLYLFFSSLSFYSTFYNIILILKKITLFVFFIYFIYDFYYLNLHNKYLNKYIISNNYNINYEIYNEMFDYDTAYLNISS